MKNGEARGFDKVIKNGKVRVYDKATESYEMFKDEAKKHKWLNRNLWLASSILSVSIAITASIEFTLLNTLKSGQISAVLALILPLVTGYVVLRTPEKLWIQETHIRNRLKDLIVKLEFQFDKNPNFDWQVFEEEYLEIMGEANKKWVETKQGNS